MATCTQCGAELKPGTKFCENCGAKVSVPQPAAQPAAVPQPPVQPTQAAPPPPQPAQTPPQPQQAAAIPMQAAHLPPRSPGRTQRILTRAMRPAHRRRPAQAHRFTPETHPRLRPHRRMLPMLSRRHRAARAATLTAMWPPAASPSAPAHQ